MQISYTGYDTVIVSQVVVFRVGTTTQNVALTKVSNVFKTVTITGYKKELSSDNASKIVLTSEDIKTLPTTEVYDMGGLAPGIYQRQRCKGVSIGGARTNGTLYIIDGVQVQNTGNAYSQVTKAQVQNQSIPEYKHYVENDFMNVRANPLSTMSVDVDRASYANIRRIIRTGIRPPADVVRVEEMINYFHYQYPQPTDNNPITINTEITNCPWSSEHLLLRVGLQGLDVDTTELPPSNLVFLIDVSGSMSFTDRLPLLIDGMKLLVNKLRDADRVAIVTYAGAAGLALPPTTGSDKTTILAALNRLSAGGSTAGGAGIMLAYKTASDNFIKGGNNRVILATDGDFNVRISSDNELEALIVKQRESGIFLTCLGFGTNNYKDAKLEILADKGNGNYHYIDNIKEAQKSLVDEFGGTLFTIAKDVKAQIEFNPAKIQGFRLVGYENRLLNTEDFKDDKKDAGDMGSGHTVTIIYELIPAGINDKYMRGVHKLKYRKDRTMQSRYSDELATIKFRYKLPDGNKSKEMVAVIDDNVTDWDNVTENTKFATAVAMFGMLLKDSQFKGSMTYDDVVNMASANKGADWGGIGQNLWIW